MDHSQGIANTYYTMPEEKETSPPITKIPRPPNAFMMFAREYRPILLNKTPNVENKFISIKLGQMWKAMTAQQKAKYFYMAKLAEQRHRELYPDYRYVPKKKKTSEEPVRPQYYIEGRSPRDNQGPYSLTRKLEALNKTVSVCDVKTTNQIVYVKQSSGDVFNNQICLTPQQPVRIECNNDPNCHPRMIGNSGQTFQPIMSSAFQQYPAKQVHLYHDLHGQSIGQPVMMNQLYCDNSGKRKLQQTSTQDAVRTIQLQKEHHVTDFSDDIGNPPPLKKVHLRNMNDPETTIEVLSENSLSDGVYFIQTDTTQQTVDKDYKNDETYVKVADKTYTDISNNTIPSASASKETSFDVLNQWIQFFQTVMPGEKFMRDTMACPCLAFLACNEEFALKLGWKPGEVESFQNFVKSRLSSIVGENGITGPCTSTPVKENENPQQEMAAPVSSSKDAASRDNNESDHSSIYEDASSNSANAYSFSETSSSSTSEANESIEGQ